jgi:S1-C subfamily serine protease
MLRHSLFIALTLSLLTMSLRAEELPSLEDAAATAQGSVATVRILDRVAETADEGEAAKASRPRVTVCTGVCVEKGWLVTPAFAGSDSQIRLTLPGGQQSQGQLRVIDEYSGLALIEADTHELKTIKPAATPVKIGAWVLSAAAWGVEQPVISLGILGGQDRTVGGMQYPPLLQADLRTTETSGGAALVNRQGELLGIVVLVDDGKDRRGWTYAVPVSHVQRLLRARVEQKALDKPMATDNGAPTTAKVQTSVVILKRRRPVVGMVLDGIGESVVVKRIEPNSPAAKAGLKLGDVVQAVDGIKIRSVYQAVTPVLYKQPGDVVTYEVQQGGETRKVEVALGGGVELPSAPLEVIGEYLRPKVDIEATAGKRYIAKSGRDEVREVFAPGETEDTRTAEQKLQSPSEQVKLLEKTLERYRAAIAYQQDQLTKSASDRRATQERIEVLERELERLKTQMIEQK